MKKFIIVLSLLFIPLFASASIDTNLYYGVHNKLQVTELQEFLIDRGLLNSTATGNFYSLTLSGVKKYQASVGISSTGYVGVLTRKSINNILLTNLSTSNQEAVTETGNIPTPATTPNINSNTLQEAPKVQCVTPIVNVSQYKPIFLDGDGFYNWQIELNSSDASDLSKSPFRVKVITQGFTSDDIPTKGNAIISLNVNGENYPDLISGGGLWNDGSAPFGGFKLSNGNPQYLNFKISGFKVGESVRFGINVPAGITIHDPCNTDSYNSIASSSLETIWSDYITFGQ